MRAVLSYPKKTIPFPGARCRCPRPPSPRLRPLASLTIEKRESEGDSRRRESTKNRDVLDLCQHFTSDYFVRFVPRAFPTFSLAIPNRCCFRILDSSSSLLPAHSFPSLAICTSPFVWVPANLPVYLPTTITTNLSSLTLFNISRLFYTTNIDPL